MSTSGNVVLGNLIGTDGNGTAALGGGTNAAVAIISGAAANTLGGTATGAGNVISGDPADGVYLADTGTSGNVVLGNLIGTDVNGTAAVGNLIGVNITNGATSNTVGGTASGSRNVISGNNSIGAYITGTGTSGNVVLGNLIGTDVNGTAKLGNSTAGVQIGNGATANTIGGAATGAGNVISGNGHGLYLLDAGTSGNVVLGNFIGTDIHGTAELGNTSLGVVFSVASGNTVGGTASGDANVISGNGSDGVLFALETGNVLLGNLIGTDVNGTANLGNGLHGVLVENGAYDNTIGGGNVISNNVGSGVELVLGSGNLVQGNLIGTDIHGTTALGNGQDGVIISNGATANTVGGTAAGSRNVISGNEYGVAIGGTGVSGNVVLGNLIGTDVNGTAALGNTNDGVLITAGATANTIGGTASGAVNVISGNLGAGVQISNYMTYITSGNVVLGNLIGADVNGGATQQVLTLTNPVSGTTQLTLSFNGAAATPFTYTGVGGTGPGSDAASIQSALDSVSGGSVNVSPNGANTQFTITFGGALAGQSVPLISVQVTSGTGTASVRTALGNSDDGVLINNGATANTIGGAASGSANVISGNGR